MYSDDDMLMLSGIQHYRFCPRQWALATIEQQWDDNRLTIEGSLLHEHVDDPFYRQRAGSGVLLRSVAVASPSLGLYGIADIVELHEADPADPDTIAHPRYPGRRWRPVPLEYKHGRPKRGEEDKVQLAAQAICLEEMYGIHIPRGAFFYGQTRRRLEVEIDQPLRELTAQCAKEMHEAMCTAQMPQAHYAKRCDNCSLINICMPKAPAKGSAKAYLDKNLYECENC